jgi:hypothetical protein
LIFDIELLAVTREQLPEEGPKAEADADDESRPKLNPRLPPVEVKPKRQGRRQDGPQMRTSPM